MAKPHILSSTNYRDSLCRPALNCVPCTHKPGADEVDVQDFTIDYLNARTEFV